jgi:hypothetical protein
LARLARQAPKQAKLELSFAIVERAVTYLYAEFPPYNYFL